MRKSKNKPEFLAVRVSPHTAIERMVGISRFLASCGADAWRQYDRERKEQSSSAVRLHHHTDWLANTDSAGLIADGLELANMVWRGEQALRLRTELAARPELKELFEEVHPRFNFDRFSVASAQQRPTNEGVKV